MRYHFPRPERANQSDSKLYSHGSVPELDAADIDYRLELCVHTADPHLERKIGREIVSAINLRAETLAALRQARALIDSVAFVAQEGDTVPVLAAIDSVLNDARFGYGPEKPAD